MSEEPSVSFSRVSDDRLEATLYGAKIAIPIRWWSLDDLKLSVDAGLWKSLRELLADEEGARRFLSSSRNSYGLLFSRDRNATSLISEEADRFLPSGSSVVVAIYKTRAGFRRPGTLPEHWPRVVVGDPDEYGFSAIPGPIGFGMTEPTVIAHRLPAAQRLWPVDADLHVLCHREMHGSRMCGIQYGSFGGRAGLNFRFYTEPNIYRNSYYPEALWKEMDLAVHNLVEKLFIGSPDGELK